MLTQAARYLIRLTPPNVGAAVAQALATRTQRAPVSPAEQEAMRHATRLNYDGAQGRNAAWGWGDGPLVILVHGWGGRAAQLGPLAQHLAGLGFRAVAIDVTGHGDSADNRTRWAYFLDDIAALTHSLTGEVHAYVGHSAGGLTVMAARRLRGLRASRYACICAPSHPYPPVDAVRRKLDPPDAVVERYKTAIARQFETTWSELQTGSSFAQAGADTLLFYDEKDRFIHHSEGDKIQGLCPGSRLIKTQSYGHGRILGAPELAQAVGEFVAA